MNIAIIDYGMGNIKSVANAFAEIKAKAFVTRDPKALKEAQGIVLPGVGAFRKGMDNLRQAGLLDVLEELHQMGKPFLGICLGMQLLADVSSEHGKCAGLGWIPGQTVRIKPDTAHCRIPHMGWNDIDICKPESVLFKGFNENPVFYFVHSYHLETLSPDTVSAVCDHGGTVTACVESDNVYGVQFHPEKSQKAGLKILQNFLSVCGEK